MSLLLPFYAVAEGPLGPDNKWFVGPITEIYERRTVNDNVHAMFEGGKGSMFCRKEEYGKSWLMVTTNMVELSAGDSDSGE